MIRQAISKSSLPHKEELTQLVRDSYFLTRDPNDPGSEELGVSRFGGRPDLPAHISWPTWNGKSLSFIAQINLMELPPCSERFLLPEKGWFYFFYDSKREAFGKSQAEKGSFEVFYTDTSLEDLHLTISPTDLAEDEIIIPARISFKVVESEPNWEHPLLEQAGLSFDDSLDYSSVVEVGHNTREGHRMLGYPMPVQYPPAIDCEMSRLGFWEADLNTQISIRQKSKDGAKDWELLLQVESDDKIGMYWPPDCGILYFMIQHDNLLARRFENTRMVKQSS